MKKRFIVVVLDGFGIGAMEDTRIVRPEDEMANTLGSILKDYPDMRLPVMERLGLMNAYGGESRRMRRNPVACFGRCELEHYGADTFMGHQEIMGTRPQKPENHPFLEKVKVVKRHLEEAGHNADVIERQGLKYLVVDHYAAVGDNLEADPGICYNVTAPLDLMAFDKVYEIARLVREAVTVSRVIAFGGTGNNMDDLWNAEEIKSGRYIGIASARSKSYEQGYQCRHLGYGVDEHVQAPALLTDAGIACTLIGKAADIVVNDGGKNISCVPTEEVMRLTVSELDSMETGFICTNVQETDLAGHSQSTATYRSILEIADRGIGMVLEKMSEDDILVVMADHGNDPKIGSGRHTRECVPLLVYKKGTREKNLGVRKTLSDVGATVCGYFGVGNPQNGTSFLKKLE